MKKKIIAAVSILLAAFACDKVSTPTDPTTDPEVRALSFQIQEPNQTPGVRKDTFYRTVNGVRLEAVVEVPECEVCPPPIVVDTAEILRMKIDTGKIIEAKLADILAANVDTAAILASRPPDTVRITEIQIQPVDSAAIKAEVICETCPDPIPVDTLAIQDLKVCPTCPEPVECPDCPDPVDPDPVDPIGDINNPWDEPWWPEGSWTYAQEDSIINARFNFVMDSLDIDIHPNDNGVQYVSFATRNWFRNQDMTGQGLHSYVARDSTFAWWYGLPPLASGNRDEYRLDFSWSEDSKGYWVEDKYSIGLTESDYTVMFKLGYWEGDTTNVKYGDAVFLIVRDGVVERWHNQQLRPAEYFPWPFDNKIPSEEGPNPYIGTVVQFAYWDEALDPRTQWKMEKMARIYGSSN